MDAQTGSCDDFAIPTTIFENYISSIDDSFDVDCIDVGIRHSDDTTSCKCICRTYFKILV